MKEERFFYDPEPQTHGVLPDDEAIHAHRVLRLDVGDQFIVMDGNGSFYNSIITAVSKKRCEYEIINTVKMPRMWNAHLHIAMAPTKNIDRTEWFIEKAVEIGIDEITLLDTDFSERKKVNESRMNKIIISAMKQSRKPYMTKFNGIVKFDKFINTTDSKQRYICHCYSDDNIIQIGEKSLLKDSIGALGDVLVMIGPEGDFSINEVLFAEKLGFKSVSLGDSRLRTETAALIAVHIMRLFTQ